MNSKLRLILAVSIIANIFFLGKALRPIKQGYIETSNKVDDNEANLKLMNTLKLPLSIDTSVGKGDTIKLLVVGNSISSHPPFSDIYWKNNNGMAATSVSNDYPHLLLSKLAEKYPLNIIHLKISNFAIWERSLNMNFGDIPQRIELCKSFKPDISVFQLGENVSNEKIGKFENAYDSLIGNIGSGLKILTTPFMPNNAKNEVIIKVAQKTNSLISDLSHLAVLDSSNMVKFDQSSNYNILWTDNGVGVHPGDKGMKNIADLIFQNIYTAYGFRR